MARVWSPPHPEEIDAAGTEPTQGHLLHVEQAEDGLDKAEKGEGEGGQRMIRFPDPLSRRGSGE